MVLICQLGFSHMSYFVAYSFNFVILEVGWIDLDNFFLHSSTALSFGIWLFFHVKIFLLFYLDNNTVVSSSKTDSKVK